MTDPGPQVSQSIDGWLFGGSGGVNNSNVNGPVYFGDVHYETRVIRDGVRRINANERPAEQLTEFRKWPAEDHLALLCEVRADRAVSLVTEMARHAGLRAAMMALLERADDSRMTELLSAGGLPRRLAAVIIVRLSPERAVRLVRLLAEVRPEQAAGLVEIVAGLKSDADSHAGLTRAATIFPRGTSGPRVLAALSEGPAVDALLARLPKDRLRTLLAGLRPDELCRRLRQAPGTVLGVLSEMDEAALPMKELAQALNGKDLDGAALAGAFCAAGPARSRRWLDLMTERRAAWILARGMSVPSAAPMLDAMERDRAVRVLRAIDDEERAAQLLLQVDRGSAAELLRGLAATGHADWVGGVLARMPNRVVGALLVWITLEDGESAKRLRVALAAHQPGLSTPAQVWRFGPTGWPALDACVMMWTISGLARRGPRGTRDTVGLWRCLRDEASPPDHRKQRTILAVALPIAFLAGMLTVGNAASPAPARSAPPPSSSAGPQAAEPAGSPQLSAYQADWPARYCPVWRREASVTLDSGKPAPIDGVLRLRCRPSDADGYELAVVWYPPTPDGDRFTGRPTTAGAYQVVTKDRPRWSTATGTRAGTYLRYYPEKGQAAIWLEDEREPVALMLFGPPGGGDVFSRLREILDDHGYRLS